MRRLNCRSYDCEIISCEAAGGSTCTAALRNPFDTYPDERLLIELQLKYLHPNVASDLSGRLLPFLIKTNNEVSWGEK